MIDLNADSDKGTSKLNKNKQTSGGKNGLNGVQSNANEVERLRTQLTEERREHRRALFDIRALIDRHIAKVDKALEDEEDKAEVEKMKMKAVEVELNQGKSITEEIKRKVEAEKKENQRKRMREEREEDTKDLDNEDPFDKIRATAKENFSPKSPQLSVSVSNGSKAKSIEDLDSSDTLDTTSSPSNVKSEAGKPSTPAKTLAINKIWKRKFGSTPTPKKSTSSTTSPKKEKLYPKGEHLAVLNTYDSFFICKTMQNIFAPAQKGEKRIKIKWLTQDSDNPTSFHYDYEQRIAFSSILSNVVLERGKAGKMILSKLESDRVNKILQENNEILEGGGDSGKDDTSDKDMEEEEELNTKIEDAIGKLSSSSGSPKWKRSPDDKVNSTEGGKESKSATPEEQHAAWGKKRWSSGARKEVFPPESAQPLVPSQKATQNSKQSSTRPPTTSSTSSFKATRVSTTLAAMPRFINPPVPSSTTSRPPSSSPLTSLRPSGTSTPTTASSPPSLTPPECASWPYRAFPNLTAHNSNPTSGFKQNS